jgi:hypothetical protein
MPPPPPFIMAPLYAEAAPTAVKGTMATAISVEGFMPASMGRDRLNAQWGSRCTSAIDERIS